MEQPIPDRDLTADAFARHVNRGKVDAYAALGLDVVIAMSQNISIGPAFGIYCLAVAVEHRRALVATARHWWVLAGVAAIALVHPLYYF